MRHHQCMEAVPIHSGKRISISVITVPVLSSLASQIQLNPFYSASEPHYTQLALPMFLFFTWTAQSKCALGLTQVACIGPALLGTCKAHERQCQACTLMHVQAVLWVFWAGGRWNGKQNGVDGGLGRGGAWM